MLSIVLLDRGSRLHQIKLTTIRKQTFSQDYSLASPLIIWLQRLGEYFILDQFLVKYEFQAFWLGKSALVVTDLLVHDHLNSSPNLSQRKM